MIRERIQTYNVVVENGDTFDLECTMFEAFDIAEMMLNGQSFEVFRNGLKCTSRQDNENLFNHLVEKYGNNPEDVINLLDDEE